MGKIGDLAELGEDLKKLGEVIEEIHEFQQDIDGKEKKLKKEEDKEGGLLENMGAGNATREGIRRLAEMTEDAQQKKQSVHEETENVVGELGQGVKLFHGAVQELAQGEKKADQRIEKAEQDVQNIQITKESVNKVLKELGGVANNLVQEAKEELQASKEAEQMGQ